MVKVGTWRGQEGGCRCALFNVANRILTHFQRQTGRWPTNSRFSDCVWLFAERVQTVYDLTEIDNCVATLYMGYQLWTSPVTGYRRTGTRLRELRSLFESGITARAILEPLLSCPSGANAIEFAKILHDRDFDVAGVQEDPQGHVIGFIFRDSLQDGIVRNHLNKMTAEHLISDATPLASLLSIFKTKEHVFVLVGQHVGGIITRADLNKPPVRVYLFGLISLLDMHLTYWVKDAYPNDDWKEKLSDRRLKNAEKLLADRQSRKQQTDLVDCLQFCDKRDLLLAHENVRNSLRLGEKNTAEKRLVQAEKLRDLLAHSQQDLTEGSSWVGVIEVVEWIETVVHTSDDLVEKNAIGRALATERKLS
jgi:hypothetical protein